MKKILLVENSAFLINVYARQLRKAGYSTTIATEAEGVVEKIKNVNPDLLVFDADAHTGEALSFLRKLKDTAPKKDFKTVVLSGFGEKEFTEIVPVPFAALRISKAEHTAEEIADKIEKILS